MFPIYSVYYPKQINLIKLNPNTLQFVIDIRTEDDNSDVGTSM